MVLAHWAHSGGPLMMRYANRRIDVDDSDRDFALNVNFLKSTMMTDIL